MKKTFLFLALSIGLFSCKKDYTCTCEYGNGYDGRFYRSEVVATYTNVSKSEANEKCIGEEFKHWAKYMPFVTPKDSLIVCTIN